MVELHELDVLLLDLRLAGAGRKLHFFVVVFGGVGSCADASPETRMEVSSFEDKSKHREFYNPMEKIIISLGFLRIQEGLPIQQ